MIRLFSHIKLATAFTQLFMMKDDDDDVYIFFLQLRRAAGL